MNENGLGNVPILPTRGCGSGYAPAPIKNTDYIKSETIASASGVKVDLLGGCINT